MIVVVRNSLEVAIFVILVSMNNRLNAFCLAFIQTYFKRMTDNYKK